MNLKRIKDGLNLPKYEETATIVIPNKDYKELILLENYCNYNREYADLSFGDWLDIESKNDPSFYAWLFDDGYIETPTKEHKNAFYDFEKEIVEDFENNNWWWTEVNGVVLETTHTPNGYIFRDDDYNEYEMDGNGNLYPIDDAKAEKLKIRRMPDTKPDYTLADEIMWNLRDRGVLYELPEEEQSDIDKVAQAVASYIDNWEFKYPETLEGDRQKFEDVKDYLTRNWGSIFSSEPKKF